jgi:hypothetical protein
MTVNAKCAIRHKNTLNILLQDAQHLHHLNTLIDTIRWLVIATGRYVNIRSYKLLISNMNIHLKGKINVTSIIIIWDVPVFTNPTLAANQPDIIQHDIKEKTFLLMQP